MSEPDDSDPPVGTPTDGSRNRASQDSHLAEPGLLASRPRGPDSMVKPRSQSLRFQRHVFAPPSPSPPDLHYACQ